MTPSRAGLGLRTAAAIALLVGGALHAELALDRYGTEDLITLFFVNAIGSALVATWMVYDRRPLALLAGLAIAVASLVAFGLSRLGDGIVGFRGVGLEPSPEALVTVSSEAVAVILLGAALYASRDDIARYVRRLRS